MIITSVTNEKVKQVAKLQKSASERRENALFVVEGLRLFMDAPVDRIHEVYYTEAFYERLAESYDNGDENEHETVLKKPERHFWYQTTYSEKCRIP